jgi:guanylate kinase
VYGTSLNAVERVQLSGRICILDIDVQGYRQLRHFTSQTQSTRDKLNTDDKATDSLEMNLFPDGLASVAVIPPNLEELELRLRGRATESDGAVKTRLRAAEAEIGFCESPEAGFELILVNHDSYTVSTKHHPSFCWPHHKNSRKALLLTRLIP